MAEERHELTVHEAGRLGGARTSAKYGVEHYRKIGRLGGEELSKERGPDCYRELGHQGGKTTLELRAYFAEIARMGVAARQRKAEG